MIALKNMNTDWLVWGSIGAFHALIVLIAYFVMFYLKRSMPYKMAVGYLVSNSQVQIALGPPIYPGWWILGKLQTGTFGSAYYTFPIQGSMGKAFVSLMATRSSDTWTIHSLSVRVRGKDTGQIIKLV